MLSTRHQTVHLHSSPWSSPDAFNDTFSPTLTTTPFERSSSGRFEASSYQQASEGLPPSSTQREKSVPELHHVTDLSSWHTVGA